MNGLLWHLELYILKRFITIALLECQLISFDCDLVETIIQTYHNSHNK